MFVLFHRSTTLPLSAPNPLQIRFDTELSETRVVPSHVRPAPGERGTLGASPLSPPQDLGLWGTDFAMYSRTLSSDEETVTESRGSALTLRSKNDSRETFRPEALGS